MSTKNHFYSGFFVLMAGIMLLAISGCASSQSYHKTSVYDARFGKGFDPFKTETYNAVSEAYIKSAGGRTIFITDDYGDEYGLELESSEDIMGRFDPQKKYTIRYTIVFNYTGSPKDARLDSIDGLLPKEEYRIINNQERDAVVTENQRHENEQKAKTIIGEEIVNYRSASNESLSVIKQASNDFYIQYENNTIGPFARFFKLDNDNDLGHMGEFSVTEINNKLLFIVLATKPVSWGLEGIRGSIPIIGYNGNIYYPYYEPDTGDKLYYDITQSSHELVYIKKTNEINYGIRRELLRLYKGSEPVSNEYGKIIPFKIDMDDNIFYLGKPVYRGTNEPSEICRNETILFRTDTDLDFEDVQITSGNNFYYIGNHDHSLYRNDKQIVNLNDQDELKDFIVSNDEKNLAYTIFHPNGSASIFKNGSLVYKTSKINEMIFNPVFSPDGTKLFYFEVYNINRTYLAFYIRGPGIPINISGPYLKPYWSSVTFSNDSKYVAFEMEGFERGLTGVCIVLNSQLLGPYISTRNNHFTDDSKKYIFQYKTSDDNWVDKIIDLK